MWAHEGLRLFQDRLVGGEEKRWTDEMIDSVAASRFPTIDTGAALARPILFSNWLSKEYRSVDRESVREYAKARLKGYSDEELDASLVLHDSVLDLALSCDRVLRQPAGHLLLIGASGSGRTTVTRFCAWLRGLSLFSISTSNKYTEEHFDDDLRSLLRRVGCKGEKVCWTIDESQMSNAARLEKLNTLLANAEVAGLFEGDEHSSLISQLKEASQREGLMLDAEEELFAFFRGEITRNLHVTLTMNPPEGGTGGKALLVRHCLTDEHHVLLVASRASGSVGQCIPSEFNSSSACNVRTSRGVEQTPHPADAAVRCVHADPPPPIPLSIILPTHGGRWHKDKRTSHTSSFIATRLFSTRHGEHMNHTHGKRSGKDERSSSEEAVKGVNLYS